MGGSLRQTTRTTQGPRGGLSLRDAHRGSRGHLLGETGDRHLGRVNEAEEIEEKTMEAVLDVEMTINGGNQAAANKASRIGSTVAAMMGTFRGGSESNT